MSALQIEEGKFYKTRGGITRGPMSRTALPYEGFDLAFSWSANGLGYTDEGAYADEENHEDLIEEVPNPNRAIDNETLTTTFAPVEQIVNGFGDISAVPLGGWSGDEVLIYALQSAGVSVPEENLVLPASSAKPALQIEEGKYYKRRCGEIEGPMRRNKAASTAEAWPWRGSIASYKDDGQHAFIYGGYGDLLEEVPNPNVATSAPVTRATDLAQTAANLVGGDRDRQHGQKRDNFTRIAAVWNPWLDIRKDKGAPLDAHDVGCMMAMMKLARTQSGKLNLDDYIDAAGYAACAGEVAQTSG